MFRSYLIPMSLLVFGCSSSTTNEANTGGQAGMAGQAGAAGSNTGGANTGGVGNTGGSNIGGDAGNPSGGMAGDSGMGGTGGGGGTGGVCVPKTCATFSYEKTGKTDLACGVIQDGCGNVVDCGNNCPADKLCEGAAPNTDGTNIIGTKNICGGGCTKTQINKYPWLGLCPDFQKTGYELYDELYICNAKDLSKPPSNSCFYRADIDIKSQYSWCCVN